MIPKRLPRVPLLVAALVVSILVTLLVVVRFQNAQTELEANATALAQLQASQSVLAESATQVADAGSTAEQRGSVAQSLALAAQAQGLLAQGESNLAIAVALEAIKLPNPPLEAQLALSEAAYAPGIRRVIPLTGLANSGSMIISPDARTLLFGGTQLTVIETATGQEVRRLGESPGVMSGQVVMSPDGRRVFTSNTQDRYAVWDLESGEVIAQLEGYTVQPPAARFSPAGRMLLLTPFGGTPILWDVETDREIRPLDIDFSGASEVAFTPDGHALVVALRQEQGITLFDIETGVALRDLDSDAVMSSITAMTFSPDGAFLFTGESNGSVLMWDMAEGVVIQRFDGNSGIVSNSAVAHEIARIGLSPDGGRLLVSGHWWNDLILWQVGLPTPFSARPTTGTLLRRFPGIGADAVTFSPDGRTAVVGPTNDSDALVLGVTFGPEEGRWFGHRAYMTRIAFSPDGQTVLSGDGSGGLILWDAASGRQIRQMREYSGGLSGIVGTAFTPDGQAAITASDDGNVLLWDINTGEILQRFGSFGIYTSLALSPDGSKVAVGEWIGQVIVWDMATGAALHRLTGHDTRATGVAFSPDGETLVSTSLDDTLIIWDVTTGEMRQRLTEAAADHVAFSPDGQTLLTVKIGNGVTLWDMETQTVRRVIPDNATSAAFSPDGNTILIATEDSIVVLDTATGLPIRRWRADTPALSHVAFSPDGRRALTSDWNNSIAVWRIDTTLDGLIEWIYNNRYVPELTCQQQEQYRAEPYCDENGLYPTRTPFATWTPLPTIDLARMTATATASISPIPPTVTSSPPPPRP